MSSIVSPRSRQSTTAKKPRPIESSDPSFRYQNGSRLHNLNQEDAPYPLSYDREILDLWAIDHALIQKVKHGQLTLRDFKGEIPGRVLDLGTALGDWVIACAGKWPTSTFVGFDMVNIQIPLQYVEPSVANRIQWVNGNFLTSRLPFPDNEFDYVHMQGIGFAIPEPRWHDFLDEVNRVLKPNGTIEILQEDALFPILPKWFTRPLHADRSCALSPPPSGTNTPITSTFATPDDDPHDHALLEHLFNAVFESRFINPKPSSILPVYFSSTFRHVKSPPLLQFPMPPIAPLMPLPGQQLPPPAVSDAITSDPTDPCCFFMPTPPSPTAHDSSSSTTKSSTVLSDFNFSRPPSSLGAPSSRTSVSSIAPTVLQRIPSTTSVHSIAPSSSRQPKHPSLALLSPMAESSIIGGEASVVELFPIPEFEKLEDKVLYMQLYRAAGLVFATKEAMWDELAKLVEKEDALLKLYGWRDEDFPNLQLNRKRFETLYQRYKDDMHVRLSLWHSLTKTGWTFPRREPLTGPELAEEERLRQMILESRRDACAQDFDAPSRTIRLLIGVKG
ncbi:unnamed protein product [Somion occarium]|uniref:Methyltransferase domain-containing protein n=1 Tax=Somion occarium TaxID=3059160 RepID=A0ABP1D9W8_9APHY